MRLGNCLNRLGSHGFGPLVQLSVALLVIETTTNHKRCTEQNNTQRLFINYKQRHVL